MLIDQSDGCPQLLRVAVQPVLLMHRRVSGLEAEREYCTVRQCLDKRLCDLGRGFEALSHNRGIGVVHMEDIQPLVLACAAQHPCYWLGVGNRVLELLDAFGAIGVDVGRTTDADIPDPGVHGSCQLFQDILLAAPQWESLLRLDAELAASLEADTSLVELDLVGQGPG